MISMSNFTPYNYQSYCINRVIDSPALGLFLDMGLGKTIITLTAINELKYNRFSIGKVLIIAPKKVAETTWSNEVAKWQHLEMLRVSKVLGTEKKRIEALNTPADIFVTNRENVAWLVDYYKNDWPFDMVVIDEFSSFKNAKSVRFKALNNVRSHIKRIVGLTGTPAPNGVKDLWAQVFLLDQGHRLGKSPMHFRNMYLEPDKRNRVRIFSYKPADGAEEVIQRNISDICVSMKSEDYLELPDIIYRTIPVYLDKKAEDAYLQMEKDMILELDGGEVDAGSAAVLTNKLLQLCNGAIYDSEREVLNLHDCKMEVFGETVEALNGGHALVFYNFKHDKDRIIAHLAKKHKGLVVRELKKPEDEADWNAGKIDILLAHPASAGYGLNLQHGGNHVIWFGLNWSLELYQQANKRLHRQGQTDKVFIHHLVYEEGVDGNVMAALSDKGKTQDSVLEALKARIDKVRAEVVNAQLSEDTN